MSFAENLVYLRQHYGVTQEGLAEQLGVSRQTVSKWEAGTNYPEMDKLLVLCDLFHVSMDDLMRGAVSIAKEGDTERYDRHMNRYDASIVAGVMCILVGVGVAGIAEALRLPDNLQAVLLLSFVVVGVEEYLKLADEREATQSGDRRQMRSRSDSPARTKRPQDASARAELAWCVPSDDRLATEATRPQLSGGEQRTLRKLMQSNERKIETLNAKVDAVRAEMAVADPSDFTALGDFQAQINDLQSQIDALEEEWMEAAEQLG